MTNQKRESIYRLADTVREAFSLKTPLDLYSIIINDLQGDCIEESLDSDISGMIQKVENSFKITINMNHSDGRRNFTIAHELGHLFLHMGYLVDPEKWDSIGQYVDSAYYRMGYSEEEYEANQFAGALLMPSEEYKKFVNDNKNDGKISLKQISSHFNVTEEAAHVRGKWLGIFNWD